MRGVLQRVRGTAACEGYCSVRGTAVCEGCCSVCTVGRGVTRIKRKASHHNQQERLA